MTLVELLVAIGIIALLVSILLPATAAVRRSSRALQCESNMRQICVLLISYASENRGRFPPNFAMPSPTRAWHDSNRVGRLVPNAVPTTGDTSEGGHGVGGPLLICPEDPASVRSYAMNVWASSKVNSSLTKTPPPLVGTPWTSGVKEGSRMILLAETWSSRSSPSPGVFCAPDTVGAAGSTPGARFGAGAGVTPPVNSRLFGPVNCELPYVRHASGSVSAGTFAGRVNLGYADGHVALKAANELADPQTGKSTFDSLWSPLDYLLEP